MAAWLKRELRPTSAMTTSLAQGLSYLSAPGHGPVAGNRYHYEAACARFVRRLSRQVYGKTHYRRTKKLVPYAVVLEGDGSNQRYHLHWMFRRPDHLTAADFEQLCMVEWFHSPWAMPDVRFEEIAGEWIRYACKEGPEALLSADF